MQVPGLRKGKRFMQAFDTRRKVSINTSPNSVKVKFGNNAIHGCKIKWVGMSLQLVKPKNVMVSRSLFLLYNYLMSVTAGGPIPRAHEVTSYRRHRLIHTVIRASIHSERVSKT